MNWLCKIGIHDWEIVEEQNDIFKVNQKKVCLRCGKIVDEIAKKREKFQKHFSSYLDRQELAKLLIDNPVQ